MSKISFFRHAQASYLSDNYDQLSPKGIEQSHFLGKYLARENMQFDKVYSGPLVRQKHTCQIVGQELGQANIDFPMPIILDGLAEHLGPQALKQSLPQLRKEVPVIKAWFEEIDRDPSTRRKNNLKSFQYFMGRWMNGIIKVPDIQTWDEFMVQVRSALATITEQTNRGEHIAVFTSGGTISAIICEVLEIINYEKAAELNYLIKNTSRHDFYYSNGKMSLDFMNNVEHLDKEFYTLV